ncbi:LysE/ArgO family amino acid transporter [Companilactobacillus sp.]|jgi:L-lysine exporter family protein LysE/ArgO|uniref:LysE/ArgO family amino acid transporter n=1 Tax=Companilactobacillus sp. TaxID=2767905 RepID=UPI0025C6E9A4|nr:LysE family transporter [Companilactobacillus sp.]MCH4009750.1 LysE family transporter [Companilactobacillus sp.]MCH4052574.1 LysE family transporter [Companilactobacillus sp.]MCH4077692.1 LysE family transporter [Companilactobacillus sp.]MCH4126268.1 LysE family transporter [Companilactobacillus sp.]MCI1311976.1 LysE family transporter [Companilactobacillus sp.]
MNFLLQGLTMGLAYVAPIGLQNLFVINSSLEHTKRRAFLTALIVILFDIALSLSCFFGIGALMHKFQWLQMGMLFFGSLIVMYIGVGLLRAKPDDTETKSEVPTTLWKTITTAFVVTWCNPQAIMDGTMMLAAFNVSNPASGATPFISGVAMASVIWFSTLTLIISSFKNLFNEKTLRWINVVCGIVIMLYGIKLLITFLTKIM